MERVRIRWGWFFGCILLGAACVVAGLLIAPAADQGSYLAGVLGGVGTTLLLVGIVVLLERRIIDTAVRAVRSAAEESRLEADRLMRERIRELEERMTELWSSERPAAEKHAQTKRMTDEFTKSVVDDVTPEG